MHPFVTRYLKPADEQALFTVGVTSWRLDIDTTNTLQTCLDTASWHPIPDGKSGAPFVGDTPVGHLNTKAQTAALNAVGLVLNDPVLFPGLRQLGRLQPTAVELQNGAFDDAWHHDHLSNKRGHAGQFFFIAYLGEPTWDPAWGGGFHYGARTLGQNWPQAITAPQTVHTVWPKARTALLGWNENPTLVHRAAYLQAPKNRTAFLMPVDIIPHHL